MEEKKDKKVVYISGPITGVKNYREIFKLAEDDLTALGYTVLNPAVLPGGLTNAQYLRIDMAMLDCADAIVLLPGWAASDGATLEKDFARYKDLPRTVYRIKSPLGGHVMDELERRAWLETGLMEAFMWAPRQEGVRY